MPKKNDFDVDKLLKELVKPGKPKHLSLRELFERRIEELDIPVTNAREIMDIQLSTLNGILDGTQKRVDFTNLVKLSDFLQISRQELIDIYLNQLQANFDISPKVSPEVVEFIKTNFDLAALKKSKLISSISDFEEIQSKLTSLLGLKKITDYEMPKYDVAFSVGGLKPKNNLTRALWIKCGEDSFEELDNPNQYSRDALIEYFPQIRWHSTNVKLGLINVFKSLFQLGVSVIFQPTLSSLQLKGATFSLDNRPCVILSNYMGFYPTLWHSLIHELYHILFDWEEIRKNKYHLSEAETDQLSVKKREDEADEFAREYLFSKEKMDVIRPRIYDKNAVSKFAYDQHVHPSFVYAFHAFDKGNDRSWWGKARNNNPTEETKRLLKPLTNSWENFKPTTDFIRSIKYKYYL